MLAEVSLKLNIQDTEDAEARNKEHTDSKQFGRILLKLFSI